MTSTYKIRESFICLSMLLSLLLPGCISTERDDSTEPAALADDTQPAKATPAPALSPLTPQTGGAAPTSAPWPKKRLPDGRPLSAIKVHGIPLSLEYGQGRIFGAREQALYQQLKKQTQDPASLVQWIITDLDTDQVVAASGAPDRLFYGASVTKVFVAGAAAQHFGPVPPPQRLQQLADMVVVSDNQAWGELQGALGGGDQNRGRRVVQTFAEKLGIKHSKVFRGWMDRVHGNEITARDLSLFLGATARGSYRGAELVWALMSTARTGHDRGQAYLPKSLVVASKTGSYQGVTLDPMRKISYRADVKHHAMAFHHQGRNYGMVLLTDQVRESRLAILAGGLFREYIAKTVPTQS